MFTLYEPIYAFRLKIKQGLDVSKTIVEAGMAWLDTSQNRLLTAFQHRTSVRHPQGTTFLPATRDLHLLFGVFRGGEPHCISRPPLAQNADGEAAGIGSVQIHLKCCGVVVS